jgi:tripartite-type tricarboxylate transporter receptor subunit TctC
MASHKKEEASEKYQVTTSGHGFFWMSSIYCQLRRRVMKKHLAMVFLVVVMIATVVFSGCSSNSPTTQGTPAAANTTAAATTSKPAAATTTGTAAATTSAAASTSAAAPATGAAAEFYKGKTITLYTGGTAGSGSDLWARTIAKYLPDVTGAKVVVVNESAGNGKMIFNQLATTIKGDGLSIAYSPVGTVWPGYMTGDEASQYDITKFQYIGGVEGGNLILCTGPKSTLKTIDDLKKAKGLKFAHSSKTATTVMANALAIDLFGLDGKIITGFDGATGRALAVQQGDADATVMAADTAMINKAKGTLNPIMQLGVTSMKPGQDLPLMMASVKAESLNDNQKRLMGTIDVLSETKSVFAPPSTPKENVDFLTVAFKKVYDNKAFQDDLQKVIGAEVGNYVSGADLSKAASNLAAKKGDMGLWTDLINKYVK